MIINYILIILVDGDINKYYFQSTNDHNNNFWRNVKNLNEIYLSNNKINIIKEKINTDKYIITRNLNILNIFYFDAYIYNIKYPYNIKNIYIKENKIIGTEKFEALTNDDIDLNNLYKIKINKGHNDSIKYINEYYKLFEYYITND